MKANKIKRKQIRSVYITDNSRQKKDRIINIIIFTMVFSVAVVILSQMV